jgi:hypothetical protein
MATEIPVYVEKTPGRYILNPEYVKAQEAKEEPAKAEKPAKAKKTK